MNEVCIPAEPAEPAKRRTVTDEEFRLALTGRPGDPRSVVAAADNRFVMRSVVSKHQPAIAKDERDGVMHRALWRCLQNHQTGRQKFTTSLHQFTRWECERLTRDRRKSRAKTVALTPAVADGLVARREFDEDLAHVQECIEKLPYKWQRDLIRQYYLEGMNLTELGAAHGYSKEHARVKLKDSIYALKRLVVASFAAAWVLYG
jgi:DNA-directed RNA polymerase specialized sigma24 family protein